jgi:uncharacterized protein DUF6941
MDGRVVEADAFLADSVVAAEGKLYALGVGWNTITVPVIPFAHPRIGIGVLVRVPYTATNQQHSLVISLEDGDGGVVALGDRPDGTGKVEQFSIDFNVGRPPTLAPGDEQVVPFALQIDHLPFEQLGPYRFVFAIDGEPVRRLMFRVNQAQQQNVVVR